MIGRARTESERDGPWCVDVWWQTEVAPVLNALISNSEDRALAEAYLIETLTTYASCRWCGHQHGTAWEQVEGDG